LKRIGMGRRRIVRQSRSQNQLSYHDRVEGRKSEHGSEERVATEALCDAQKHPKKRRDLIVRVAGCGD
jgi:pyruvate-formate lyase